MATKGINSYVFGKLKLRIFSTVDEALAYVDEKVAATAD